MDSPLHVGASEGALDSAGVPLAVGTGTTGTTNRYSPITSCVITGIIYVGILTKDPDIGIVGLSGHTGKEWWGNLPSKRTRWIGRRPLTGHV